MFIKRTTTGYFSLAIAVSCYAFVFYKIGIEPGRSKGINLQLKDAWPIFKIYCLPIAIPGLVVFFSARRLPIASLIYLAVVLAWALSAALLMRNYVDHGHGYDTPFSIFLLGLIITWPAFFIVMLLRIGLALEWILTKLEARFDKRRPKSETT